MNDYRLSKKEMAELERVHRSLRDKRQADRVKAIIALARGWSASQIAEILLMDEKTARQHFQRYRQGGIKALREERHPGVEPKLDEFQMKDLSTHLETHIQPDAKAVIHVIEQRYGVCYSVNGVTDLLHRLGFSYKKPTHVPGKQNPAAQKAFLEEYEQLKRKKGPNDPIYFADTTHPQHNSLPTYGWIKRGQEKELKANCGRQRLNINGAINVETLESTTAFYETINADSTLDLFTKIEAKHPKARTITIVVDNARYYHSRVLKAALKHTKIELVYLPPYSPNLNLIERYWKFFKKKVMANRYYATFEEFKRACRNFFQKQQSYWPELKSLLTENFHIPAGLNGNFLLRAV